MTKISVDRVQPGMVLARDLQSEKGRMLFGKGTVILEKHLRILRIWGVLEVEVEEENSTETVSELSDELRALYATRFSGNDTGFRPVAELMRYCLERPVAQKVLDAQKQKCEDCNNQPQRVAGNVRKELDREFELVTMPVILSELMDVINSPHCSSHDISRVVEKDTSLAARLLKIVNSPFYGFPSKVDTISRAVTIVGTRQLTTLALGIKAIDTFRGIPADLMDMESFWRHSLYCGYGARLLAGYTTTSNPERFFVAGLLHDIGRLILFRVFPEKSAETLRWAKHCCVPTPDAERKAFGLDHSDVGAIVLKNWRFPVILEDAVRYHHRPEKSPHVRETGIVHFSDVIACALENGKAVDTVIPPLSLSLWQQINPPALALAAVAKQVEFLYEQTARYFLEQ